MFQQLRYKGRFRNLNGYDATEARIMEDDTRWQQTRITLKDEIAVTSQTSKDARLSQRICGW
jgi:hypothetical protein